MIYDLIILPLLIILRWTVIPFIPKARERVYYEKRMSHFKGAKSFHEDGIVADLAFEFSSEGEFQQCLPLVEAAIAEGKKIELIYFSPSVEKGVHAFYEKHQNQVRVLNFPLLTYFPSTQSSFRRWVSAKKLILVRYDFLPEILLWSRVKNNELILIWASFKRKRLQNRMLSFYQQLFLKASKAIIAATEEDKAYINKHGLSVTETFDFREIQILKRLESREQTLLQKFPHWSDFSTFLESYSSEDKVIFGNAWPKDLDLLSNEFAEQVENKEKLLVIVPHLVGIDHAQLWRDKLKEQNLDYYELYPESSLSELLVKYKQRPAPIIIHLKGVLCELYHYFRFSYVGGGHGVSVHSLLEPFVSGSQFIACGPKVERSTEFDLSNQDYPVVSILADSSAFQKWIKLKEGDTLSVREKKLESLKEKFHHLKKRLLAC